MEKVFNRKLKKLIDSHDVVSFDIFDTLIKRNCFNPTDIFDIVEMKYNENYEKKISKFREKRILAEKLARDKYKQYEDVTLKEIYECLSLDKQIKNKLQKIEIDIEIEFCQKNYEMFEIYKYCVSKKKKVICISDMYLPKNILKQILSKANYNIDNVFISCDYRKTKLTGSLYEEVLLCLKCKKNKILHIGDSWRADFISPKKIGIQSFHISKRVKKIRSLNKLNIKELNKCNNIIYKFIANNSLIIDNKYEKLGYEIIGPMCLEFCNWINMTTQKNYIDNLLFCARDMKMMQKIYNLLYPKNKNSYFFVSRKSTYLPYLFKNKNYNNFIKLLPIGTRKFTISEILNMFNFNLKDEQILLTKYGLEKYRYDANELISNKNMISFYKNELLPYINTIGKEQYNNFISYLKSLNITSKTAIVDLGWRGTTQDIMIDILNQNLYGMYLGLNSLNGKNLRKNYFSFLYVNDNNDLKKKVYPLMSTLELLLSATHGSTISYTNNLKKTVILGLAPNEKNELIENLQNGALKFIEDFSKYNNYINEYTTNYFTVNLVRLLDNPTLDIAKNIGEIYTENIFTRRLASPKSLLYYIFNFNKLKFDLKDSEWKIGFCKRLFKIKLPYFKIYNILKYQRKRD